MRKWQLLVSGDAVRVCSSIVARGFAAAVRVSSLPNTALDLSAATPAHSNRWSINHSFAMF